MQTFDITYRVRVEKEESIDEKVDGICLEQSVELPRSVLSGEVETKVVGRVSGKKELAGGVYEVVITWPLDNVGDDISQFINIMYGNISLQPGIRITGAEWEKLSNNLFGGPAYGIDDCRNKFDLNERALSGTALKPLGSSSGELADFCYEFACGGIDIIKDDHGLANQKSAPFEERVKACVESVRKAADETGRRSYYFPNITALASDSVQRYERAAELGADGVLICPHIAGLETMHQLARLDLSLPVIAHPAFSGGLTTHENQGLTPEFLYGQLWRALGADFVIFPNTGGRFSFTQAECTGIAEGARSGSLPFKAAFPMPAGGIQIESIPRWLDTYGTDTVFLLGGSLYDHPGGIRAAAKELSDMLRG